MFGVLRQRREWSLWRVAAPQQFVHKSHPRIDGQSLKQVRCRIFYALRSAIAAAWHGLGFLHRSRKSLIPSLSKDLFWQWLCFFGPNAVRLTLAKEHAPLPTEKSFARSTRLTRNVLRDQLDQLEPLVGFAWSLPHAHAIRFERPSCCPVRGPQVATLSRLLKQFGLPERSGWDRQGSLVENLGRFCRLFLRL